MDAASILQPAMDGGASRSESFRRGQPGDRERLRAVARHEALQRAPRGASLLDGWRELAAWGRRDLVLGRLVEGHVDAANILAEAGRNPVEGAVYGVWASGSQGTGLQAEARAGGWRLTGRLRYCTAADWVDRALVAVPVDGRVALFDLPVTANGWRPQQDTWQAVGMDLSDSVDVVVDAPASTADLVGPPGFYLERRGFSLGGIGVAAVWLGGAAGVLDAVTAGLRRFEPDPHQLAHLGAMSVGVLAADAVLARAAGLAADLDATQLAACALACRAAVDACVQEVLTRAPRLTGPTPICRDGDFAHRLADLAVYVRQQHAERDLAALGRHVVQGTGVGVR